MRAAIAPHSRRDDRRHRRGYRARAQALQTSDGALVTPMPRGADKEHSDYIPAHRDMPCGPRVYTFFVYMSDVEEGGNTSFPQLGLSVEPKKGRAVLWPSVLDAAPRDIDERTMHIANPVLSGIKYSVNFWIHQHDFKANHAIGCTG